MGVDNNMAEEVSLDKNNYQWQELALLDKPDKEYIITDTNVWDMRLFPDLNKLIFILNYETKNRAEYYIYLYNSSYLRKLYYTVLVYDADNRQYAIPEIYQISQDQNYVSLKLHPCWGCTSLNSKILLLNIQTADSKIIQGPFAYFKLLNNGKHAYKEEVEIECKEIKTTQYGPCFEELKNLPLKYGQFQ